MLAEWQALAARLQAAGRVFVREPPVRFQGGPGEQWTMFSAIRREIPSRSRVFLNCLAFSRTEGVQIREVVRFI